MEWDGNGVLGVCLGWGCGVFIVEFGRGYIQNKWG